MNIQGLMFGIRDAKQQVINHGLTTVTNTKEYISPNRINTEDLHNSE